MRLHPSRRGQVAAPQDEGNSGSDGGYAFSDHAQLLLVSLAAPVTCATAASLMVVPISFSSLPTYCAICSSSRLRWSCSFIFLMSSDAMSTGGTVSSVTRNTIHSLPPELGVCPAPSLAVRNAAVMTLAGTPGGVASRLKLAAVSTFRLAAVAS